MVSYYLGLTWGRANVWRKKLFTRKNKTQTDYQERKTTWNLTKADQK